MDIVVDEEESIIAMHVRQKNYNCSLIIKMNEEVIAICNSFLVQFRTEQNGGICEARKKELSLPLYLLHQP